jgi:hypothetical protein
VGLSLVRLQPRWVPYYVCFAAGNYVAMVAWLLRLARAKS